MDKLDSNFTKKVLLSDLNNTIIKEISSASFDYLIIDFISDRFGLIKLANNVFVTNSDDFRKLRILNTKNAKKILADSDYFINLWLEGLKYLLSIVPKEKIIINNVFWADKTNLENDVSTSERRNYCNAILEKMYNILSRFIPSNNFINYPSEIFIADEAHKWSIAPFHYTQPTYHFFSKRLNEITSI